jgi:hypothetical protein
MLILSPLRLRGRRFHGDHPPADLDIMADVFAVLPQWVGRADLFAER